MAAVSLRPRADTSATPAKTASSSAGTFTTNPNAQADHSSSPTVNLQTGIGVGLAIAAFVIFVVLGVVWLLIRRHKRKTSSGRHEHDNEQQDAFDSIGSTLVRSRNSIPMQNLHELRGKGVGRGSEMMTSANSHEISALPPTRNGEPAEMPTIWNEGYRGRRGTQIRRDSEFTSRVSEDGQASSRRDSEITRRSEAPTGSDDARYTFLID